MVDTEKLSALMDDEYQDAELIDAIAQDSDAMDVWKHYHLIGDVLRGDLPQHSNWDIAGQVALALENEPVYQGAKSPGFGVDNAGLEAQPKPHQAQSGLPLWLRSFGQVGIAACVSLVVIVGVRQYTDQEIDHGLQSPIPVLQTVPFAGSVEPVSLTRDSMQTRNQEAELQEQHYRINALLQDYELQLRLNAVMPETHVATESINE